MTVECLAPDTSQGVAYRLSSYLDCQARALGENGYQALAGGPMGTALVSGLVTVFVALIGYRLLLGHVPNVREGVGWAVRLGIVLALVTSWPAFQALFYRIAVDAPTSIAAVLLPASGLSGESLDARVQEAYDTLRLGTADNAAAAVAVVREGNQPVAAAQPQVGEPLPKTASLLVISTAGLAGALRIAIGFLLAVAPFAVMSLLFSGANGLFIGWLRAVAGLALGLVAATVVTAIQLVALEGEIANILAVGADAPTDAVDPQALTTMVCFFALIAIVSTWAALRMGSAIKLPRVPAAKLLSTPVRTRIATELVTRSLPVTSHAVRGVAGAEANARAAAVADVLSTTLYREQRAVEPADHRHTQRLGQTAIAKAVDHRGENLPVERIGLAGRRSLGRNTRSAARRDQVA